MIHPLIVDGKKCGGGACAAVTSLATSVSDGVTAGRREVRKGQRGASLRSRLDNVLKYGRAAHAGPASGGGVPAACRQGDGDTPFHINLRLHLIDDRCRY